MTEPNTDPVNCVTCGVMLIEHRCPECKVSRTTIDAWRQGLVERPEAPAQPEIEAPSMYPPPRRSRRRGVVSAAVGVVVGLVAGLLVFAQVDHAGLAVAVAVMTGLIAAGIDPSEEDWNDAQWMRVERRGGWIRRDLGEDPRKHPPGSDAL